MIALTGYTIFHYLLNRRLVQLEELFTGEVVMVDNPFPSTRNANFVVCRPAESSFFVKQPRHLNEVSEGQSELRFYQLVGEADRKLDEHCLRAVKPIDTRNRILILEYSDLKITFEELVAQTPAPFRGNLLKEPTHQLGQLLAGLRDKLILNKGCNPIPGHRFGTFVPWLLKLGDQEVQQIEKVNNLYLSAFGRFIKHHRSLLASLLANWQSTHLINTDVCWRNVLTPRADDTAIPPYVLIDWEFASVGDPLWEIVSLAADYLLARFHTVSTSDEAGLSNEQYHALIPVLLHSSMNFFEQLPTERRKAIQLLGVLLLQKYFRWAVEGSLDKLTNFPEVFTYAQRCLTQPESVILEFNP
ncbi:phosphotransferase [Larkinella punicea]|uniref:Uncharacterized protein n=1 Tax=Larkinella punicea TaxID=2315727 RepID=A0A368JR75_9BACT|nr:phosphotransferase [Larkinella punicea]RCR69982.1 hypothetical protein DUE52_09145 [Larkinella punicea]